MNNQEIKTKIIQIIENELGINIQEDETLKEQGVDSLSIVSIIVTIENEFSITFDDVDLQPDCLNSVATLVSLVEKYI